MQEDACTAWAQDHEYFKDCKVKMVGHRACHQLSRTRESRSGCARACMSWNAGAVLQPLEHATHAMFRTRMSGPSMRRANTGYLVTFRDFLVACLLLSSLFLPPVVLEACGATQRRRRQHTRHGDPAPELARFERRAAGASELHSPRAGVTIPAIAPNASLGEAPLATVSVEKIWPPSLRCGLLGRSNLLPATADYLSRFHLGCMDAFTQDRMRGCGEAAADSYRKVCGAAYAGESFQQGHAVVPADMRRGTDLAINLSLLPCY
eukprot:357281-Chlamydomonas_euryale.AAC.16